jgi:hypothetical protein
VLLVCSGSGDLVATSSAQDIRLWSIAKNQELLRIEVPNMKCNAIAIMADGKSIISGMSSDLSGCLMLLKLVVLTPVNHFEIL